MKMVTLARLGAYDYEISISINDARRSDRSPSSLWASLAHKPGSLVRQRGGAAGAHRVESEANTRIPPPFVNS